MASIGHVAVGMAAARLRAGTGGARIGTGALAVSMLLADRIGLVALIASGYRALAWLLIAIYVVPLLLVCGYRLARPSPEVA